MNDDRTLEQTVRGALHDAADHAPLAAPAPAPLVDVPGRVTDDHRRPRVQALVAAGVLTIVVALAITALVVGSDSGDGGVRVAAPATEPREVSVDVLPRSQSDLFVYFVTDATDEQVAAVRAQLESSPDVTQYAFLDHAAAKQDFAEVYACNPALVRSIRAEDLPVSFRVVTVDDPDAVARVQSLLGNSPGVTLVAASPEMYAVPARSDETVTPDDTPSCTTGEEQVPAEVLQPAPTTVPPTLPPAGDPPADPTSSRDAVAAAFTQAWDGTLTIEQRRAAMQGSDQLAGVLDQARTGNETTIASMRAVLGDITFVAPDRAAVVFHLEFDNGLVEPTQVGDAVLEDGTWKVSRETVCAVLSGAAGVSCPS